MLVEANLLQDTATSDPQKASFVFLCAGVKNEEWFTLGVCDNILLQGCFLHLEPGWTHLHLLLMLDAINGSAWAVLTLLLLSLSWIL